MADKRVAIVQSNYIPWKGYFDLIDSVDEFVLYDDMQYTRRDWRNRNRIKTAQGTQWLTIPVQVKGRYEQQIDETNVSDPAWAERHWATLAQAYARADCFDAVAPSLSETYASLTDPSLSLINRRLIEAICELLSIRTKLSWSTEYDARGRKTERLVSLCKAAGASEYVSGPAAKAYLDAADFEAEGIAVSWFDYSGYPEYPQPYPPFEHKVSIVDLLFCTGRDARRYVKRLGATVS